MAASVEEKRTPSTFEFRSVKPLFDGSDFTVNAREDGADLVLWTADEAGQTAMEARVTW
jgi:3-methylfumaryl-CoA hydratase